MEEKINPIEDIENFIDDCIQRGILSEFLTEHKAEVVENILGEIFCQEMAKLVRELKDLDKDEAAKELAQELNINPKRAEFIIEEFWED